MFKFSFFFSCGFLCFLLCLRVVFFLCFGIVLHYSLLVFPLLRVYLYIPPSTAAKFRVTEIITRSIRFIEKQSFFRSGGRAERIHYIQYLYRYRKVNLSRNSSLVANDRCGPNVVTFFLRFHLLQYLIIIVCVTLFALLPFFLD